MIVIWQNTRTGENRIFENVTRERARQMLLKEYGKETVYNEWKWFGNFQPIHYNKLLKACE